MRAKASKLLSAQGPKPTPERGGAAEPPPSEPLPEQWLDATHDDAPGIAAQAGDRGAELVQAWIDRPNADAIAAVATADGTPGPTRKAARRALGVLRSRGVEVCELPAPVPGPESSSGEGGSWSATFVSPDSNGMVFFSISQKLPGGNYRVADAVVQESVGIVHVSSGRLAGKQIRRWRQRVESRFGARPTEVPIDWARWCIAQARRRAEQSGQVLPLGLESCAPLFEPVPPNPPEHPLAALERELGEAEIGAAGAGSADLHREPELRTWLPAEEALQELLVKLGERISAAGTKEPELAPGALDQEIAAATDRYFTPERRELLAGRMRDAAIPLRARTGEALARRLLALAEAVRRAGLITTPPREIPFLLGFFHKGVAMLWQQSGGNLRVPVRRPISPEPAAAGPEEASAPVEAAGEGDP
ncbi:MAG: hypothetical protein HY744_33500 [Deltaproteobacteria bacterium]|nr:hypothetical protein [Deltaproteobacteria bacterium]